MNFFGWSILPKNSRVFMSELSVTKLSEVLMSYRAGNSSREK